MRPAAHVSARSALCPSARSAPCPPARSAPPPSWWPKGHHPRLCHRGTRGSIGPTALAALLLYLLLCLPGTAHAADLHRGIAITNWFRFPASRTPGTLARYVSDSALSGLRAAGFDFVRLAIDPAVIDTPSTRATLLHAIQRIQRAGLTVVVSVNPTAWKLETSQSDRDALRAFWQTIAPELARLDPARTVPEILNEPVFPNAPAAWAALQHQVLTDLRCVLPRSTIVLTGQDWGSIDGLLNLPPESDPNVLYSFHFYTPPEFTALAPWRHDIDRAALTRLPFPAAPPCEPAPTDPATVDLIRYYCAQAWNPARLRVAIDKAVAWAAAHRVRLFAGEFGATAELNRPARLAWIRSVRTILEADHTPWALWGYDDIMGFNLPRPPGPHPRLDPSLLLALGLSTPL